MQHTLELLAPARNLSIGIAAIDCGADAVYIAGPGFGARQAAGNSLEDIAALCSRVMVLGHGQKLFDGKLPELLSRFDTVRTVEVRYDQEIPEVQMPEGAAVEKNGKEMRITYSPAEIPTARMISLLQEVGGIREMTLQPENIDHLIAAM